MILPVTGVICAVFLLVYILRTGWKKKYNFRQ